MPGDIELAKFTDNEHADHDSFDDTKRHATYDSGDDSDDGDGDEGDRSLLGSQERRAQLPTNAGKVWPQISSIVAESAPTLLLTTVGLLFTGELLDKVSRWRAMIDVDQLIILIPVILNLKGNLEMNLSARLGTAANVGELDDPVMRRTMIVGNLTLLQVQAAVVSFVSACVSLLIGLFIPAATPRSSVHSSPESTLAHLFRRAVDGDRRSGFPAFIMVASSAMTSACLSSIVLGSFMCLLIVVCRKLGRDPDNIAPPIATFLGDLVTLCFLGVVATVLNPFLYTPLPGILGLMIIIVSVCCFMMTRRNTYAKPLLTQGWSPLFGAMIISCGTGIVLDIFVSRYEDFALLAVVISGLPGSVGSIFVSRLSTALHSAALSRAPTSSTTDPSPKIVLITLFAITIPIEIIFLAMVYVFGWLRLPILFIILCVIFFCITVLASLVVAQYLTGLLWSKDLDPDLYALPIHSALLDLVGQLLLVVCFEIASVLGARVFKQS